MDSRTKITLAIRQSCRDWPWLATLLLRIRPVEKSGIGTAGCDERLKFYYDPEHVDDLSMDDLCYIIKKSITHPVLRHSSRGKWIINDSNSQEAFTIASDLSAHQMFSADNQYIPDGCTTIETFRMKDGSKLPSGLCLEEYFSFVLQDLDEEESDDEDEGQGEGQGEGQEESPSTTVPHDSGVPETSNCPPRNEGSSQDGQSREWEDEPEVDDGVSDDELDRVIKHLAETASNSMSNTGSADFSLSVAQSTKPKVRPEQLLRQAVAKKFNKFKRGAEQQTFRRPSRRFNPDDKFIRPSYIKPTPSVTVVVDSSASMGSNDISLGLGMIDLALKGMQLGEVRVVSGDTDIKNDQKRITRLSDVEIKGGGGTDMGKIVNKVLDQKNSDLPDLVILVTDGGTAWPDKNKVPFIACVTREKGCYLWHTPPEWMPLVYVS